MTTGDLQVRAIQTTYKGYRFRSRTEARWAVFFDAMGWDWEYEVEGFEMTDGTRYLPDFIVTMKGYDRGDVPRRTFIFEVKPDEGADLEKAWKLARFGGYEVVVVEGPPAPKTWKLFDKETGDKDSAWQCYFCWRDRLWFDNWFDKSNASERVIDAINASRGARFEFGEGK